MDGSIKSDARLEVSISFGRFENNELSWEKWSSFSPNKYLEEVGTLSTPGSVAQKKAYFEAHYKKIAAKKAEESEHDHRFMYPIIPISNALPEEPSDQNSPETPPNDQRSMDEVVQKDPSMQVVEEVAPGSCVTSLSTVTNCDDDAEVDTGASFLRVEKIPSVEALTDEIVSDEQREADVSVTETINEETKGNLIGGAAETKSETEKELVSVSMENHKRDLRKTMVRSSTPERKKTGVERGSTASDKERAKVNSRSLKATPTKKERDSAAAKRKVITPSATKSLPAVTPRQPKSASSINVITPPSSASTRPSKKKLNSSSLPTSKKPVVGESKKKFAPTSLHMSLSLGSPNSSSSMTRKSLIMEKMGDKDIVKRAFKAFQNHRILDEKPLTVLPPASQPKLAATPTRASAPVKGNNNNNNGPTRKDAQKLDTPKSESVIRSSLYPPSSRKWKDSTAFISPPAAASVGLKSDDDKAEKRKEFLKKLEARSKSRVAENAAKSTEVLV